MRLESNWWVCLLGKEQKGRLRKVIYMLLIYIHDMCVYVEVKGCPVTCQAGTEWRCRCIAVPILEIGARSGWVFNAMPRPLYHQEGDWYPLYRRLRVYIDDIIIIKEVDFTKYQVEIARRRTIK